MIKNQLARSEIGTGVHFSSISDSKFKHNRISVNFILPLDRNTASDNAVVPFILRKGCRQLPDFTSLNARLQELYGASLGADISKFNGYQVMEVSIRFLDNRYALEGEDLVTQCAQLLSNIVFDPKLDSQGLFDETDVSLERQFIIDTIEAEINEKRRYALNQCISAMCKDEPIAVRTYGYVETAEKITPASATSAWKRMMDTARIEIMFIGSGNPSGAKDLFAHCFDNMSRSPVSTEIIRLRDKADTVQKLTETMDLSQSKLVMGLRCAGISQKKQSDAYRVFSALFGGTPFSKLFLNVREKLSLCYYCASRFDASNYLLLVDSGVEAENNEKAQEEILRQLADVQKGDFSDDDLRNTKLLLSNSIINTTDSLSAMEGWYLTQILRGSNLSPQDDLEQVMAVTRDEVIAASKGVTLDTIYFLTGNGEDQKEGA